jgi:hypothetical protein
MDILLWAFAFVPSFIAPSVLRAFSFKVDPAKGPGSRPAPDTGAPKGPPPGGGAPPEGGPGPEPGQKGPGDGPGAGAGGGAGQPGEG